MKKTAHEDDQKEKHADIVSNVSEDVEKALDQSPKETRPSNATTKAILKLKTNPFFNDKRKWDDSFTIAEKKDLEGNIVKAAKDNDGETYVTLKEEEFILPQLSLTEEDSQESDDLDSTVGNKKPGRKPMPDEDGLSDPDQDPKVKRKAQNRAAQRAFRERKERYVKELEIKIKQVQDSHLVSTTQLVRENQLLRAIVYKLEMENASLKGVPYQPFQSELNSVPQYQPQVPQRHQTNYPHIAPSSAQPMLLPSPMYPISPVLSVAFQNAANTISSPPKAVPKKVSVKPKTASPPPTPQPLEYTFSISTPASLRPSQQNTSSKQSSKSEPIELVQLYPPSAKPFPKTIPSPSPSVDTPSVTDETSSVSTECTQVKKMHQLELDFSDCHIDTEGQKFCNQLHDQVCNDAFDRLLSEPLFDQMGKLNLSIGPVPILTGPVEDKDDNKSVKSLKETNDERLLSCQEIWFVLNRHSEFHKFTTDQLCQAVKEVAKCSDSGPVLGESDLLNILTKMDQGYF